MTKKILLIATSSGNNLELIKTLAEIVSDKGAEAEILDLTKAGLILYTPDAESKSIPDEIHPLREQLIKADGVIVSAPEYNGSIPPTLNNYIAWISRSGSEDWRAAFNGKLVALATHSGSGGTNVLNIMRHQFSYLGSNVLGRTLHTNMSKPLNPDSAKSVIDQLLKMI